MSWLGLVDIQRSSWLLCWLVGIGWTNNQSFLHVSFLMRCGGVKKLMLWKIQDTSLRLAKYILGGNILYFLFNVYQSMPLIITTIYITDSNYWLLLCTSFIWRNRGVRDFKVLVSSTFRNWTLHWELGLTACLCLQGFHL